MTVRQVATAAQVVELDEWLQGNMENGDATAVRSTVGQVFDQFGWSVPVIKDAARRLKNLPSSAYKTVTIGQSRADLPNDPQEDGGNNALAWRKVRIQAVYAA